ncbi:hypothetical protein SAMN04490248_1493 [Salinihabitans flavidus]|uniref:DUF6647 domain-containing protein n=1 Tax=Salinihabitans flavidus TaxID=569882 RepID=A0A1H8W8P3_9RHOB|nr:DUF6647 family protein [Salinihabitans flavidus]SEP24022.1 hypothetical protein SAMN04490248_1493 [Salinihabitans flavidus]
MHFPIVSSAIVALCLAAANPVAATTPREAPPLLDTIVLWLAANFDLPAEAQVPALVNVAEADLVAMRYGPEATVPPGLVVAVYDDTARTIYLSDGWTGRTPAELSVLVHEMVHHLQAVAGMRFACPAAREVLAYEAQDAWLGLFGQSLEGAFGIDAASRLVGTVCTH